MTNMSESKTIISQKLETPNGLGVDWIANNIYWTDNEHKVWYHGTPKVIHIFINNI